MSIFTENMPFEKGFYTVIGINFSKPKFKRKSYKTKTSPEIIHWFLDVYISAKHRLNIELVQSCSSQTTNLKNCTTIANGGVIILHNVEIWSPTDALMDNSQYSISFLNPTGRLATDFLEGKRERIDFDDSLSTNPCTSIWGCKSTIKKIKQAVRLARYYSSIKKKLNAEFKPKNGLEKSIRDHFGPDIIGVETGIEYVRPGFHDIFKKPLVGVLIDYQEDFISVKIIDYTDSRLDIVKVDIEQLSQISKTNLKAAADQRLVLKIKQVEMRNGILKFNHEEIASVTLYDGEDAESTERKYAEYVTVSCTRHFIRIL